MRQVSNTLAEGCKVAVEGLVTCGKPGKNGRILENFGTGRETGTAIG
jgi:hypothetical protein